MTVMAISEAKNNAELIVECVDLGYLHADWHTLDPTYGLGRFWSKWQPTNFRRHDLDPQRAPDGPMDFRLLFNHYDAATFHAVVFDPPYKLNGTGGSHPSDEAYGVATQGIPWQARMLLCTDGIYQCARVLKPGGYLLVKCQDQVCSGKVRWQTLEFAHYARSLSIYPCELVDMLHLASYRPQPQGRRQVHARRNYSTMLVLRRTS